MTFTEENTTGYSPAEIAELNAELYNRRLDLDEGSPEWYEVEKAFSDEVSGYALPVEHFTLVIGVSDGNAHLIDGSYTNMPCDVADEARPGIMTTTIPLDGGQAGTIWYWPDEGRAAVMAGGDSVWYDCDGETLRSDDWTEVIPITLAISYGMPSGFEGGAVYLDRDCRDAYSQGEWIAEDEAMRRLQEVPR
jgi:hypothetical protein